MPPSRELLVLRHAKAAWDDGRTRDFDRRLAPRGERDLPVIAGWLAEQGLVPDHVLTSPALRARTTAVGVLAVLGADDLAVEEDDRLYLADVPQLLGVLAAVPAGAARTLLVGHNPGLLELVEHLAGEPLVDTEGGRPFPTGALAWLSLPASWDELPPGCGELRAVARPRALAR